MSLLRTNQLDDALLEASTLEERHRGALLGIALGETLYIEGRHEEALNWLSHVGVKDAPPVSLAHRVALEADIYARRNRHPEAHALLERVERERPDVELHLARGVLADANADVDGARAHLETALGSATPMLADMARERLVYLLAEHQLWEEASVAGEPFVSPSTPPRLLQRLLEVSLRAWRLAETQRIVRALEDGRSETERSRTVAAWLQELQGGHEAALVARRGLARDHPDRPEHWLALAVLERAAGNTAAAVRAAQRVGALPTAALDDLLRAAGILGALEAHRAALETAYRAHREHRADAAAGAALVTALVHAPAADDPLRIAAECAVLLEDTSGVQEWVMITGDANPDPARGELGLANPRTAVLIGLRVGDKFPDRDPRTLAPTTRRVAAITSKYMHYGRELMRQYAQLYPDDQRVQQIDLDVAAPGGLDPMLAPLYERREFVTGRLALLANDAVLLERIGEQLGMGRFETWATLAHSPDLGHMVFANNEGAPVRAMRAAQAQRLLVDLSTLVTLEGWGVLTPALNGFDVFTVRGLAAELRLEARRTFGAATLGLGENGRIQMSSESPEYTRATRARIEQLAHFVETHTTAVGYSSVLMFSPEVLQHYGDFGLRQPFQASAAAHDAGAALATEQGIVGALAAVEQGVDAICAIQLVDRAARLGTLDLERQTDCWESLISTAPRYLLPPGAVVKRMVARDGYKFGARVARFSRLLANPALNSPARGVQVAHVAGLFANNPLMINHAEAQRALLDSALPSADQLDVFVYDVRRAAAHLFALLPLQLRVFDAVLDGWARDREDEQTVVAASSLLVLP